MSNVQAGSEQTRQQVLVVTGMAGAGRTSALKALEDLGYESIDNVPLSLLPGLVTPRPGSGGGRPVAVGSYIRTRDFDVAYFLAELGDLTKVSNVSVQVVFLDCDDDELRRRYAETRHRHPLAHDRPVSDGIQQERGLLVDLRERADLIVDTTGISLGELKRILQAHYGLEGATELSVFVTSFSFARGLPRAADLVFDVRFLRNPHYVNELRPMDGRDPPVGDYVRQDKDFSKFFDNLTGLIGPLLPRYAAEGKSYLTIAIGCTGGRHRSVYVTEELAAWLVRAGENVHVSHRDVPTKEAAVRETEPQEGQSK
jgi:RNase adapter protein RapZ